MARREKLHKRLAEAILRWMPGCDSAMVLRKSITREDLASSFQLRRSTEITLADWEKAIEISKQSRPRRSDPGLALKIRLVEEQIRLAQTPVDFERWSGQLARLKASH